MGSRTPCRMFQLSQTGIAQTTSQAMHLAEGAHLNASAPSTGHDANAGSAAHSCASSARQRSDTSCASPAPGLAPAPPAAAAARAPRRRASGSSSRAQKPNVAPLTCCRSSGSSQGRPSARPSRACAALFVTVNYASCKCFHATNGTLEGMRLLVVHRLRCRHIIIAVEVPLPALISGAQQAC